VDRLIYHREDVRALWRVATAAQKLIEQCCAAERASAATEFKVLMQALDDLHSKASYIAVNNECAKDDGETLSASKT